MHVVDQIYQKMSEEAVPNNSSLDANHYPGQYGFAVQLEQLETSEAENIPKNVGHTFSQKLDRLYVKKKSVCPFPISTSVAPPADSKIKIHVYAEDQVPVMRCHAHQQEGTNFISPLHYMRSENPKALYCCAETGELSIELPYVKPEVVKENIENLTFMCSSKFCIKKELFIKFSLVNSLGDVLGHHSIGLHVCSTPGRDRLNHEDGEKKKKRKRKMPIVSDCSARPEANRTEAENGVNGVYHVSVKGKWLDLVSSINRGLELLRAVPKDVQDMYLEKYYASLEQTENASTSTNSSATCTMTSADTPSTSSDTRFTLRRIIVRS